MSAVDGSTDSGSRWRDFHEVKDDGLALIVGLVVLVMFDVLVSVLLPVVIPESMYLRWYLDDSYDEVVAEFVEGRALVVPDSVNGWRMSPNASSGNWVTDDVGARVHSRPDRYAADAVTVLFLGSSVMNGGLRALPLEPLPAQLEGERLRALNYGTMLHSFDQSLVAYRSRFAALEADVVVVGIHPDHEAASNLFVPMRSRTEVYMPLFKPAFRVNGDRLEMRPLPRFDLRDRGVWPEAIDFLQEHDGSADRFESYRRAGMMPVSSYVRDGLLRFRRRHVGTEAVQHGLRVHELLLDAFVQETEARGARLIVLKFASLSDHFPAWHRSIFGDYNQVHDEMLRGSGHSVVFVGELLESSGIPLGTLYREDGIHLTPQAYGLLADALRPMILGG